MQLSHQEMVSAAVAGRPGVVDESLIRKRATTRMVRCEGVRCARDATCRAYRWRVFWLPLEARQPWPGGGP